MFYLLASRASNWCQQGRLQACVTTMTFAVNMCCVAAFYPLIAELDGAGEGAKSCCNFNN